MSDHYKTCFARSAKWSCQSKKPSSYICPVKARPAQMNEVDHEFMFDGMYIANDFSLS